MYHLKKLYVQVFLGILAGVIFGILFPTIAITLKPGADVFIKLIKMLIAPIIFLSLVSGIAAMQDMKQVGKIGGTALAYFILTTTLALALGLLVANITQPGSGMMISANSLSNDVAAQYLNAASGSAQSHNFILDIIPSSFIGAFVNGEILPILFIALLFAAGLMMVGEPAKPILQATQILANIFFKMIHIVMHLSPIAAFSAMALCIGQYGASSLLNMLGFVLIYYATCFFFITAVLCTILWWYCRINPLLLMRYLRTELLIVLGTSSSETVLPILMEKLTNLGCDRSIVGLILPVGYSFNLAGTAIYLTLAALFIAQATHTDLTTLQQLTLLGIMILSSKGAAGISGSGFVVLASSLAAMHAIPVGGVVLVLGIDRFMSDGRAITNVIGNAIATIIMATWHGAFNKQRAMHVLHHIQQGTEEVTGANVIPIDAIDDAAIISLQPKIQELNM